ncbi:MAG: hypothetical protein SGI87_02275 [Flavobacteriales bacterium]|nr:hypothetical protein [Flavobacteriales bacterium]
MKTILIILWSFSAIVVNAQKFKSDTTRVKNSKGKLGFHFGFNYSNVQLNAEPFVFSDSLPVGSISAVNGVGVSGGAFYESRIQSKKDVSFVSWRIGFQFQLNTAFLEYDKNKPNKEEYEIHSVCAEFPIQFAYYKKPVIAEMPEELYSTKRSSLAPVLAVRPGIPLGFSASTHPELNNFYIFGELGLEQSMRLKSTVLTIQLSYSRDLLSRTKSGSNDIYNTPINSLHKDLINLTLLFR